MRTRRTGKKDAWVWTIITLLWSAFGLFCLIGAGFGGCGFMLWSLVCAIPIFVMCATIKGTQEEEVLEFKLYYFELWSLKEQMYEARYVVRRKVLKSEFIFHYHIRDFESEPSQKEVEDYINEFINDNYTSFDGYKTKHEAMLKIVESVKALVSEKKANENITVRGVKNIETYTFAEVQKRIENGEFKEENK